MTFWSPVVYLGLVSGDKDIAEQMHPAGSEGWTGTDALSPPFRAGWSSGLSGCKAGELVSADV